MNKEQFEEYLIKLIQIHCDDLSEGDEINVNVKIDKGIQVKIDYIEE